VAPLLPNLHFGYITKNQTVGFVTTPVCVAGGPSAALPAADQFYYAPPTTGPNPDGIMFTTTIQTSSIRKHLRRGSYKLTPTLKLTAGLRFYKFDISNQAISAAWARHREMPRHHRRTHPEAIPACCRRSIVV